VLAPVLVGLALVVLLATVLFTDGSHPSETAAAEVAGAMKRSSSFSTGRFHLTIDLETGDRSASVEADGAYDTGAGRMREMVDASELLAQFLPRSGFLPAGLKVEVILDGRTLYASLPGLGSPSAPDRWYRLGELPGPGVGSSAAPSMADPSGLLDLFGGVGNVERLGDEIIDDVAVHHYRGEVDIEKAYSVLSDADRRRLDESIGSLGGGVPSFGSVPVEVWMDDQGIVRRMTSEIVTSGSPSARAAFTIDFRQLGEPVEIVVPDPAQVTELSDLGGLVPSDPPRTR